MTTYALTDTPGSSRPARKRGSLVVRWLTTTDHKLIGSAYLITSFAWFLFAGILAELMRTELARPGLQFLSNEQYNQLFTMHGAIMLLL
ncbi:MAG: cytochrome c oxidase subunit, partial [Frankiales bacterium]|nr:cytochrome c oxidase subunit [Frankiales bacterium]